MGMYDDNILWDTYDRDDDAWEEDSVTLKRVTLIHTTEKGYLIRVPNTRGYREAWFPKSYSRYLEGAGLEPNIFMYADWLTPDWSHMIG